MRCDVVWGARQGPLSLPSRLTLMQWLELNTGILYGFKTLRVDIRSSVGCFGLLGTSVFSKMLIWSNINTFCVMATTTIYYRYIIGVLLFGEVAAGRIVYGAQVT